MTTIEEPADIEIEVQDIIVCRDVHKWYGDFHALRGITTTIKRGEVVVAFGPSGSGKSTFIRTINKLEEHQRGDIIVNGIELTNGRAQHRCHTPRCGDGLPVVQPLSTPHGDEQHHAGTDQSAQDASRKG